MNGSFADHRCGPHYSGAACDWPICVHGVVDPASRLCQCYNHFAPPFCEFCLPGKQKAPFRSNLQYSLMLFRLLGGSVRSRNPSSHARTTTASLFRPRGRLLSSRVSRAPHLFCIWQVSLPDTTTLNHFWMTEQMLLTGVVQSHHPTRRLFRKLHLHPIISFNL